ncbi:MAG TPA: sugar ABC transporter ATP-binding protein [Anaeromyxobacter sp.]|nr:sugar ABC transporter ATP-binding protein [Anaeromyxobacter sp.]
MDSGEVVLSVAGLTKSYGAQRPALSRVSFELHRGEVLCLVGENGAGKSTLIKILSGAVAPDAGTVTVGGREFAALTPREAMGLGVATIYQDVELIESLTVHDNIFLGSELPGRLPLTVDARAQAQAARKYLDLVHIDIAEDALVEDLSAAQKQNLQIAKALHRDARILIMDEPTSSLGHEEKRSLMRLVRDLSARGIAVIYISHYLQEVFEIGDTILVLKDGEQVATHRRAEVDVDSVVRSMVGRDASAFFRREKVPIGAVRIEVKGMRWAGVVEDVTFDVRAGEVFGIGGLVGSGRSELVSLLFGLAPRDAGELVIDGVAIEVHRPADAIRHRMSFITEDRKRYAMFAPRDVVENVAVVHNELSGGAILDRAGERRLASGMIDRLRIAVSGLDQEIGSLSGGNQQKAVIARWMLEDADLYIFDEPTKGVDVGAKEEIYRLMVEFARAGKSIIMVSSDMPELLSMSDRIGIMRAGRMVRIVDNAGIDEQLLVKEFIGI